MILTDREIQIFLANKQISITPEPIATRYSSTSVDLTLAKQIRVWTFDQIKKTRGEIVTPWPKFIYKQFRDKYTKRIDISSDTGYVLEPNAFVLAWTHEKIVLPNYSRIAARVEGKSSLARIGLAVHNTAPTIHAGFKGPIQLELCNHGPVSIRLTPDMPICQLIFELTFGTPAKGYSGMFLGQTK
jgi:dCTP deaminase